ncbi:hypothetical protein [Phenylobacterium soli]|uniref:hypothetical protein n=1 Tax=Phenylobacterium soli TaxID=2170551 RepID=UPI001057DE44|nr:hypothetical protein [Phenylobacterium soli]
MTGAAELAALRQFVEERRSVTYMARRLERGEPRIRLTLEAMLGGPYTAARERADDEKRKDALVQEPNREPDHFGHCRAVLRADAPGKPAGAGFPVLTIPAFVRVAA